MHTITTGRLSRLLAAGAISLVAGFGLAACNDDAAEGGDTMESEEMSEESMDDGMSEELMEEEMSEESMDDGMSDEEMGDEDEGM